MVRDLNESHYNFAWGEAIEGVGNLANTANSWVHYKSDKELKEKELENERARINADLEIAKSATANNGLGTGATIGLVLGGVALLGGVMYIALK